MTDSAEFMSNSLAIVDKAGAIIVETMMRLKPVAERTSVTAHFRLVGQSLGFSASYSGLKTTRYGSSLFLDCGIGIEAISTSGCVIATIPSVVAAFCSLDAMEGGFNSFPNK